MHECKFISIALAQVNTDDNVSVKIKKFKELRLYYCIKKIISLTNYKQDKQEEKSH